MHLATGNVIYWMVLCSGVADVQTLLPLSVLCVHVSVIYTVVCIYDNTAGHKQLPRMDTFNAVSHGCIQRALGKHYDSCVT
jgi:hypothetical protein